MRENINSFHEDMSDRLPEYVKAGKIPGEIREHIESCPECKEEFSVLSLLNEAGIADLPEPGGMFFETLPQKIRAFLGDDRKNTKFRHLIVRLAPAFVLIAIIIARYFYNPPKTNESYMFEDPLAYNFTDLNGLSADDIPSIPDRFGNNSIDPAGEDPFEYNYYRELVSLNSKETKNLYESLNKKQKNGGLS